MTKAEQKQDGQLVAHPPSSCARYVVCLVDVLGQKDQLAKWMSWPEDGALQANASRAWRKSVGVVRRFKERFLKAFDQMSSCTIPGTLAAASPCEQAIYQRYKNCQVSVQQFSDTFVFYTPLVTPGGDSSVVGTFRILGACCIAMLPSLCERVPVRGGITIGLASELDPGSLYGPALNEAHYLESEVAQYPRVVVSDQISKLIASDRTYSNDAEVNKRLLSLASNARRLICSDTDGQLILDYLGPGVRDLLPREPAIVLGVTAAYAFVHSETRRFEQEQNAKLASRYRQLQRYFVSRLGLYGLTDEEITIVEQSSK
ncbi:MAG: hypothetical protein ACYTEL_11535 [Planctomycetota bacterium]|jgi:hypothetical protein